MLSPGAHAIADAASGAVDLQPPGQSVSDHASPGRRIPPACLADRSRPAHGKNVRRIAGAGRAGISRAATPSSRAWLAIWPAASEGLRGPHAPACHAPACLRHDAPAPGPAIWVRSTVGTDREIIRIRLSVAGHTSGISLRRSRSAAAHRHGRRDPFETSAFGGERRIDAGVEAARANAPATPFNFSRSPAHPPPPLPCRRHAPSAG